MKDDTSSPISLALPDTMPTYTEDASGLTMSESEALSETINTVIELMQTIDLLQSTVMSLASRVDFLEYELYITDDNPEEMEKG